MSAKIDFASDFYWGVSASAFQTEGAYNLDGKGLSIWDHFTDLKRKVKGGVNAKVATDFYKLYHEDLDFIEWMNCRNFRFSFAWSRIFPDGIGKLNSKGVDFYDRLIDSCLERNIVPWVTLYHWDLPLALEKRGGWRNRDVVSWFEEYTQFCALHFGDRLKNWMVLNEPTAFTGLGYFMGIHAPGKKGLKNFLPAMHHAALAQATGGRILKSLNTDFNVGTTLSFSPVEPYRNRKSDDRAALRVDALLNRLFLEPLLGLGYPFEDLAAFKSAEKYILENDEANLQFDFDFIGVQNYSREVVRSSILTPIVNAKLIDAKKRKVEQTAMGWENRPQALYQVLNKLSSYTNIPPLIVTETGIALKEHPNDKGVIEDQDRIQFLSRSISAVKQSIAEGVNLKGYFVWSLTDNFEWAEGYGPQFGLIYIDYDELIRYPKQSAYWYKNFLK